jgi:Flp pilus assembly protein TadG
MNRMMRRLRAMRSERGAALVELALVVPFLMMIMCATIDFGLAVYTLNNLTAAVREGARYAASKAPPLAANDPLVRDRVYQYIVGMNNAQTPAQVQATISNTAADANGILTVRISGYLYKPLTPLANLMGLATIPMSRTATFKYEYLN